MDLMNQKGPVWIKEMLSGLAIRKWVKSPNFSKPSIIDHFLKENQDLKLIPAISGTKNPSLRFEIFPNLRITEQA